MTLPAAGDKVTGQVNPAAATVTGMTFVDGVVPGLLGQANMQGLLFTCIGVPEYASKPGGLPGDPSAVQMVMPRF